MSYVIISELTVHNQSTVGQYKRTSQASLNFTSKPYLHTIAYSFFIVSLGTNVL
jgi:hypothetical protein